ncbi:alpha/beta hydrolase fold domain-containing protein [Natronorubrum sp. JWXQ-INN-674]|uniref:Alpha/beta hydrolase fold domain-containing protein n=1 Tax=Natronorubrum halalkaliphilum TaxID=2691917 RepID=A0A6B0VKE1_9EURY|nr:alpha/beta hydrolase [Natronorubrum halalkaliphilum]MXV62024.1 alpha/beta hydrolase fold domain-containing protein [Natronorubrum halalkaliphilum]
MTPSRAPEPHPGVKRFLERYASLDTPSFDEVSAEEARRLFDQMHAGGEPVIDLESVQDRTIDGPNGAVPIRIYEPGTGPGSDAAGDDRPLLCYFHGGGWVIGSIDTHDDTCRKLAVGSGYPVVSVDYRLAPEHPFPAGLEDCYAAIEWAADAAPALNADSDRLVVAGDSAGGNLAAAAALLARDRNGPEIAYQLLIYPETGDATATDSYAENDEDYLLTTADMAWCRDHYFAREIDRGNIYALPRLADDLSGLPPATVMTAGFDPLRDDGYAYARRLEDDGVPVTYRNYDDMIHGFFGMISDPVNLDRAHAAHEDAVGDLQRALER